MHRSRFLLAAAIAGLSVLLVGAGAAVLGGSRLFIRSDATAGDKVKFTVDGSDVFTVSHSGSDTSVTIQPGGAGVLSLDAGPSGTVMINGAVLSGGSFTGSTGTFTSTLSSGDDASGTAGALVLHDGTPSNGLTISILAPALLSGSQTITLPNASGVLVLDTDLAQYLPLAGGTIGGSLTIIDNLVVDDNVTVNGVLDPARVTWNVTTTTTPSATDQFVLAAADVTIPDATTLSGYKLTIRSTVATAIQLLSAATQLVGTGSVTPVASLPLAAGDAKTFISNGTNWYELGTTPAAGGFLSPVQWSTDPADPTLLGAGYTLTSSIPYELWRPTGGPSPREYHRAVWTGSEMIVWGGRNGSFGPFLATGARFDPVSDVWTPMATVGAPSARWIHTIVWTGSEAIIWGGQGSGSTADGARYDPTSDTWTPMALVGAPSERHHHTAVWTGSEMLVWGGTSGGANGARYDPTTNTWTPISTVGAPPPRLGHIAVWTGTEMIVWGGFWGGNPVFGGGRYDPAADSWTTVSTVDAPTGRHVTTAVWTGEEMIIWGGAAGAGFGSAQNDGARYNPVTDTWIEVTLTGAPAPRFLHAAVWTGTEMRVWGGAPDGGRYSPGTDSWEPISAIGQPSNRNTLAAVWTGTEMVVWGGTNGGAPFGDGGVYRSDAPLFVFER